MDVILFLIFAAIAVVCGFNVVVQSHPISSAISLIGVMGSLAVLYLLLGAEFLAAAQVIVYAGAIMVLFVFVIMLLNAGAEIRKGRALLAQVLGIPLLFTFLGLMAYFARNIAPGAPDVHFGGFNHGTAADVGRALFTQYLLPFEVVSVLILIAILGAVVLAQKEME
jgi:NADH-quinone oxidoreductase subunit J